MEVLTYNRLPSLLNCIICGPPLNEYSISRLNTTLYEYDGSSQAKKVHAIFLLKSFFDFIMLESIEAMQRYSCCTMPWSRKTEMRPENVCRSVLFYFFI